MHTLQGVICVGYTDLPSRLPTQSSTLYSNNLSKFLLSMGPFTGHKEHFFIDHKDDAVRGALVLDNGEMMWPAPPLKVGPPLWGAGTPDTQFLAHSCCRFEVIRCDHMAVLVLWPACLQQHEICKGARVRSDQIGSIPLRVNMGMCVAVVQPANLLKHKSLHSIKSFVILSI